MAIFRDAMGNLIDTQGTSQPLSAANIAYQAAESVPPVNSNATPVSDFKYVDPLTFSVTVSRG